MGLIGATATGTELQKLAKRGVSRCPRCGNEDLEWLCGETVEDCYAQPCVCPGEDCDFVFHEVSVPTYWGGESGAEHVLSDRVRTFK